MNREHVLTQDNALTGGNARTRDNAQDVYKRQILYCSG